MAMNNSNRFNDVNQDVGAKTDSAVRWVITPENHMVYCRALCKVAVRYAEKGEILELTSGFEQIGSMMVNKNFGAAATMPADKLSDYCIECCKVITRHATPSELKKISLAIEVFIAAMLANNYRPGLNSAVYEVYNKYVLRDKVINDIVNKKISEMTAGSKANNIFHNGGNNHE